MKKLKKKNISLLLSYRKELLYISSGLTGDLLMNYFILIIYYQLLDISKHQLGK